MTNQPAVHPVARIMKVLVADYDRKTYGAGKYHEKAGSWSIRILFGWRWCTEASAASEPDGSD